eukprot:TRINITY_DN68627_c0_g1_i1.p1 TRINITY_DN68627_c0_g1~~TRINITY_DN68627_c0_g1_i1.p1  ORF type:complete len:772 (-),score=77.23 TRINITY_DN68627_c0_g1_i1:49-2364(-)
MVAERKRGRLWKAFVKLKRVSVTVFVFGIVCVLFASVQIMARIRRREMIARSSSSAELWPNVDLSGLYLPVSTTSGQIVGVDTLSAPSPPTVTPGRIATDHNGVASGVAVAPQVFGATGLSPCSATLSSLPEALPSLPCRLPVVDRTSDDSQQIEASLPCGACAGSFHGALPTTVDMNVLLSPTHNCTWRKYVNAFLYDFVDGDAEKSSSLPNAQDSCRRKGLCVGVTCDADSKSCTKRKGFVLHSSDETTWVKICPETSRDRAPAAKTSRDRKCAAVARTVAVPAEVEEAKLAQTEQLRGAAIVVLAHNRVQNLRSCLKSLVKLEEISMFKLRVSVDDMSAFHIMEAVVKEISDEHAVSIDVWKCHRRPIDSKNISAQKLEWFTNFNTAKIAWHYLSAFERAFTTNSFEYAIFLEEDLVVSPDFLSLFRSTAWLLVQDPSIWCVSAWNDNGFLPASVDACRLSRTTWFPGLGFLLSRTAWRTLRGWWADAPTMGWDYWMRVAFKRAGKECIIPEVSRTHHISTTGSSVNTAKQVSFFDQMVFADVPSICTVTEPCRQFGDVSYLTSERYENALRAVILAAPRITSVRETTDAKVRKNDIVVLPYRREEIRTVVTSLGLRPPKLKDALPDEVRADHYGVFVGQSPSQSRVTVIAVDRRSAKQYLNPSERLDRMQEMRIIPGKRNKDCNDVCDAEGMKCDAGQLHFANTCSELLQAFPCEQGCAHQVGKELPAYVSGDHESTHGQCLVTFISKLDCKGKHASTSRLCACRPS